ncbi:hypothetical protein G9A89_010108 [Geosiphon pyriformis]|nr:hypothetical protein G9A89_010108 [Geosiphon pyriformis]
MSNSNRRQRGKTYNLATYRRESFGLCRYCRNPNINYDWCQCNNDHLRKNFENWTSGNEEIDLFLQETQIKAKNLNSLLEWIKFEEFEGVEFVGQGAFSTVFCAWLSKNGKFFNRNSGNHKGGKISAERSNNESEWKSMRCINTTKMKVALKRIRDSQFQPEMFLQELKAFYQFYSRNDTFIKCYGITQDPGSQDFMIVLDYAIHGDLRRCLSQQYSLTWTEKLSMLRQIATNLLTIHGAKFVHRDLHSGNILITNEGVVMRAYIADLGLAQPITQSPMIIDGVYGVLPYMAPEILRGSSYTEASDIYSFGIIMWEFLTNQAAFSDCAHDYWLQMEICSGKRPLIPESAPSAYVNMMKRCWNGNPARRPAAQELERCFKEWHSDLVCKWKTQNFLAFTEYEKCTKRIIGVRDKNLHSGTVYTSRFFEYLNLRKSEKLRKLGKGHFKDTEPISMTSSILPISIEEKNIVSISDQNSRSSDNLYSDTIIGEQNLRDYGKECDDSNEDFNKDQIINIPDYFSRQFELEISADDLPKHFIKHIK